MTTGRYVALDFETSGYAAHSACAVGLCRIEDGVVTDSFYSLIRPLTGVDIVIKKGATDPSSVIFEAIQKAKNEKYDILLCDTAGRLQNKTNLMKELEKMHRVIAREVEGAPQETLLVIDATTGQNGLSQAEAFMEVTNITGVILTKLDGTSKGGIVLAIRDKYNLPIKMVGLGEKMEDLEYFDLEDYIAGLFIDNGDEDGE